MFKLRKIKINFQNKGVYGVNKPDGGIPTDTLSLILFVFVRKRRSNGHFPHDSLYVCPIEAF